MQMEQTLESRHPSPAVLQYNNVKRQLLINKMEFKNKKVDANTYCSELLRLLKIINTPTSQKCLSLTECTPHICNSYLKLYDDKQTTLSRYYKEMINDSLRLIRKGKTAYLYKEEQVRDVLRFEPNIQLRYESEAFCVSLP